MILDTNKLIESEFDILKKVGWLIYNREDQEGGLNKNELNDLLHIVTVNEMEKEYQQAYDEGFNDGFCE